MVGWGARPELGEGCAPSLGDNDNQILISERAGWGLQGGGEGVCEQVRWGSPSQPGEMSSTQRREVPASGLLLAGGRRVVFSQHPRGPSHYLSYKIEGWGGGK